MSADSFPDKNAHFLYSVACKGQKQQLQQFLMFRIYVGNCTVGQRW